MKFIIYIAKAKADLYWVRDKNVFGNQIIDMKEDLSVVYKCLGTLIKKTSIYKKSTFISLLIESAQINEDKNSNGFRYNEQLKIICSYLYLIGGTLL